MKIKSKFWLEDDSGETVFGEGRRKILELIDELGSMQATARTLGMSYRGVWARVKATEERLDMKLVETSVGRGKDRGSRLTPEAKKLLANFKLLNQKGMAHTDVLFEEVFQGQSQESRPLVPAVAVVGPDRSGKRDLIGRLAGAWLKKGIRVGVILPDERTIDDSAAPLIEAGSPTVILAGTARVDVNLAGSVQQTHESIAANYAHGCDLVLVESTERLHLPTIELSRKDDKPITRKKKHLLAVVGERPGEMDRPVFAPDDLQGLMVLVEREILQPNEEPSRVELKVNGRNVPMLPFVRDIIENGLAGMIASLKACDDPRDIELKIRKHDISSKETRS